MQWSILWQGRQNDSREHCLINRNDSGYKIDSVIIGKQHDIIYRVEYTLLLNSLWETLSFRISSIHNSVVQLLEYTSDGKGKWFDNGEAVPRLEGCLDLDLPLTPLTNSLAVNRLGLQEGEEKSAHVVYVDLFAEKVSPVNQKYRRLSASEYNYQNVPNDFEAVITMDEFGFVKDYPTLFLQTGCVTI